MMKIEDLLKMDMGEAAQWLIDNQYDYELTLKVKIDSEEFNNE